MAREKKIVDASIVAKWFLEEEGSAEALKLRTAHIQGKAMLIVPDLLFLEVLNALRYKGGTEKSLADANKILWDIQFHVERLTPFLLEKTSVLALQYNLSLYDALYLALGLLHGSPVMTADKALAKAPNVCLI